MNLGRKLTPEWIENNRKAQPSTKIMIDNVTYDSLNQASRGLNYTVGKIKGRVNSPSYPTYLKIK